MAVSSILSETRGFSKHEKWTLEMLTKFIIVSPFVYHGASINIDSFVLELQRSKSTRKSLEGDLLLTSACEVAFELYHTNIASASYYEMNRIFLPSVHNALYQMPIIKQLK